MHGCALASAVLRSHAEARVIDVLTDLLEREGIPTILKHCIHIEDPGLRRSPLSERKTASGGVYDRQESPGPGRRPIEATSRSPGQTAPAPGTHPRRRSPLGSSTGSPTSLAGRRFPRISIVNPAPTAALSTGTKPRATLFPL